MAYDLLYSVSDVRTSDLFLLHGTRTPINRMPHSVQVGEQIAHATLLGALRALKYMTDEVSERAVLSDACCVVWQPGRRCSFVRGVQYYVVHWLTCSTSSHVAAVIVAQLDLRNNRQLGDHLQQHSYGPKTSPLRMLCRGLWTSRIPSSFSSWSCSNLSGSKAHAIFEIDKIND